MGRFFYTLATPALPWLFARKRGVSVSGAMAKTINSLRGGRWVSLRSTLPTVSSHPARRQLLSMQPPKL
jgi:hypothetical protein